MGSDLEYPEKANNIKQIVFRSSNQMLFDQNICVFLFFSVYKHINNIKARDKVLEIMTTNNRNRENHPTIKRYRWRRKNPLKQARPDYFLVPESMIPYVKKSAIETSYRSDHSIVTLELNLTNFIKALHP